MSEATLGLEQARAKVRQAVWVRCIELHADLTHAEAMELADMAFDRTVALTEGAGDE